MRIVITHLSGHDSGRRDILPPKRVVFGRDSECDVRFDVTRDLEVSGRHAELQVSDKRQLSLIDLGSTNGTWVNGREIEGLEQIASGDEVELGPGGPRLRVELRRGLWVHLLGLLTSPGPKETSKARKTT